MDSSDEEGATPPPPRRSSRDAQKRSYNAISPSSSPTNPQPGTSKETNQPSKSAKLRKVLRRSSRESVTPSLPQDMPGPSGLCRINRRARSLPAEPIRPRVRVYSEIASTSPNSEDSDERSSNPKKPRTDNLSERTSPINPAHAQPDGTDAEPGGSGQSPDAGTPISSPSPFDGVAFRSMLSELLKAKPSTSSVNLPSAPHSSILIPPKYWKYLHMPEYMTREPSHVSLKSKKRGQSLTRDASKPASGAPQSDEMAFRILLSKALEDVPSLASGGGALESLAPRPSSPPAAPASSPAAPSSPLAAPSSPPAGPPNKDQILFALMRCGNDHYDTDSTSSSSICILPSSSDATPDSNATHRCGSCSSVDIVTDHEDGNGELDPDDKSDSGDGMDEDCSTDRSHSSLNMQDLPEGSELSDSRSDTTSSTTSTSDMTTESDSSEVEENEALGGKNKLRKDSDGDTIDSESDSTDSNL